MRIAEGTGKAEETRKKLCKCKLLFRIVLAHEKFRLQRPPVTDESKRTEN